MSVTDPFAPPSDGGLAQPPVPAPPDRKRWTKESAGGMFASAAAFVAAQALIFEPVSGLLPEYEHRVTALTGILAAATAYPLATRWLKRLPSSAPPRR